MEPMTIPQSPSQELEDATRQIHQLRTALATKEEKELGSARRSNLETLHQAPRNRASAPSSQSTNRFCTLSFQRAQESYRYRSRLSAATTTRHQLLRSPRSKPWISATILTNAGRAVIVAAARHSLQDRTHPSKRSQCKISTVCRSLAQIHDPQILAQLLPPPFFCTRRSAFMQSREKSAGTLLGACSLRGG